MRRTAPAPSPAVRSWGDSRLLVHLDEGVLTFHTEHERPLPGGCQDLPVAPGHLAARMTAAAATHPALADTLVSAVGEAIRAVWLAPSGPAPDNGWLPLIHRITDELAIDVMAPDGLLSGTLVSGLYAGYGTGATGWYRFTSSGGCSFAGTRFPLPDWDSAMPREPLRYAGTLLEPVRAGLVVRTEDCAPLEPGHPAGRVPLDLAAPLLILESDRLSPDQVANAVRAVPLSFHDCVLLPRSPATADPAWLAQLADLVHHDIVFRTPISASDGGSRFLPFPAVIRQQAHNLGQEVRDSAPPPRGWRRHTRTAYRLANGPIAQVVPNGLILRDPDVPAPEGPWPAFDRDHWTLTLGVSGTLLTNALIAAFDGLLGALTADRVRTVRVQVAGELTEPDREQLVRTAVPAGIELDLPPLPRRPDVDQPTQVLGLPALLADRRPPSGRTQWGAAATPALETETPTEALIRNVLLPTELIPPPATPAPPAAAPAAAPALPIATPTAEPTDPPAVSRTAAPIPPPATTQTVPRAVHQTATPAVAPDAPAAVAVTVPAVVTESAPPPSAPAGPVATMDSRDAPPDVRPPAAPAREVAPAPEAAPRDVPRWPEQASTADQQARFAAAAGEAFAEGLSLVNSALAAWPVLRGQAQGAKTDYVAVCLYLTRGQAGANALNAELRDGRAPAIDSYPACLAAGLVRLPVHRSALLRQSTTDPLWTDGTLLTDPGFLSAGVHHDVTTPDARADLLIWPSTARRTTELAGHRDFGEAVFLPGRRFKILAVRRQEQPGADAPAVAYLARELDPREPTGPAADQAALAVLDQVLTKRRSTAQRLVEDPDIVRRLTAPMFIADSRGPE